MDFESFAAVTASPDSLFTPVEMHGVATGLLVVDEAASDTEFMNCIVGDEQTNRAPEKTVKALQELHESTRQNLNSDSLEFMPLLPDDDYDLAERFNAASAWARGFIVGLARRGVSTQKIVSPEVNQFLRDLSEISASEYEVDEDEEAELIYAELVEYLRMGTLMLQQELQPISGIGGHSIH